MACAIFSLVSTSTYTTQHVNTYEASWKNLNNIEIVMTFTIHITYICPFNRSDVGENIAIVMKISHGAITGGCDIGLLYEWIFQENNIAIVMPFCIDIESTLKCDCVHGTFLVTLAWSYWNYTCSSTFRTWERFPLAFLDRFRVRVWVVVWLLICARRWNFSVNRHWGDCMQMASGD